MQQINLLVIEDNYGDFVLIEELLLEETTAINFNHCKSFDEAKEFLTAEEQQKRIDLIFLDLSLKDLRGEDLIREVLNISCNIPVVVLTGYEDKTFALKCLSMGIADYVLKDEITGLSLLKVITFNIEREKARQRLEESEKSYRELFELSPLPMWVYDFDTYKFLNVNSAAILHYGYTEEEFLDMTLFDIRPEEDRDRVKQTVAKTKENENSSLPVFKGTFQHRLKNGTSREVEIHASSIKFKSRLCGLVLVHDITERVNYISAIEEQNRKLQKIAWTQSHVVRAPLSRILGLCNLISMQHSEDPALNEKINYLLASADELDQIIREVVKETENVNPMK